MFPFDLLKIGEPNSQYPTEERFLYLGRILKIISDVQLPNEIWEITINQVKTFKTFTMVAASGRGLNSYASIYDDNIT